MNEALKEASKALEKKEIPVGAVIVNGNRIIARAYNQTQLLGDATAHAEMIALTAAARHVGHKYLMTCRLYVTLEPCMMCGGAMHWAQLGHLIFGAHDPQYGYAQWGDKVLHSSTKVTQGVESEACSALLRCFFQFVRS